MWFRAVLSYSPAVRYFLEKHDWSHVVWLLSCRAELLINDHPHLFSVSSVDSQYPLHFAMTHVFFLLVDHILLA